MTVGERSRGAILASPAAVWRSRGGFSRVDAVRHALWLTLVPLVVFGLCMPALLHGTAGWDTHAYWDVWRVPPYHVVPGTFDAFNYSPAFAQAIWPLTLLPWHVFYAAWSLGMLAMLGWLVRPLGRWGLLVFALCLPVIVAGNIELLLAAAAVLGMSRPAAWAFPLLTKVTPGLGPLWFAVRREWRASGISVVATLAVCLMSFAMSPHLWREWLSFVITAKSSGQGTYPPRTLRLPLAFVLIVWGALKNRRWTIPVAMVLATPMWGLNVPAILTAIPRIVAPTRTRVHGRATRTGIEASVSTSSKK